MSELHGESKGAYENVKSISSISSEIHNPEESLREKKKVTSTDCESDSKRKRDSDDENSSEDSSFIRTSDPYYVQRVSFSGERFHGGIPYYDTVEIGRKHSNVTLNVGDSVVFLDPSKVKDIPFSCSLPVRTASPYIGRVEAIWLDKDDECCFRCRWYYKKDDIRRMKKSYSNIPRSKLLGFMTDNDLLLGTVTDDCYIKSIRTKCSVYRSTAFQRDEPQEMPPNPAYRCCFDVTINPNGVVKATAYDGQDDEYESMSPAKRIKIVNSNSENSDDDGSEGSYESGSDDDRETKSRDMDDDNSSTEESVKPPRTPVISEGTTNHKITIGDEHQAIIPTLGGNSIRRNRDSPPDMVWEPNKISDSELEKYVEEAGYILKHYMKSTGMAPARHVPHHLDLRHITLPHMHCREFNIDQIFKVLHDEAYNTSQALKAITKDPESFLYIWTKEEKVLYDIGFKNHYNAIRFITKGLGDKKNHKDVVDYFYRFKIPDQFRSYQDQKRDQARRILECVEKHRRDEYLSPECTVSTSGIATKKLPQTWIKTGGGDSNDIGAIESRRQDANDLLNDAKDALGSDKYLDLVNLLKALNSRVLSIPEVRDGFSKLLERDHKSLFERFETFLPKKFRS